MMATRITRHTAIRIGTPVIGVIIRSDSLSLRVGFTSLSDTTSETMLSARAYLEDAIDTPICCPLCS